MNKRKYRIFYGAKTEEFETAQRAVIAAGRYIPIDPLMTSMYVGFLEDNQPVVIERNGTRVELQPFYTDTPYDVSERVIYL